MDLRNNQKKTNNQSSKQSSRYGAYSYRDRRKFLVDNDLIRTDVFTGQERDYLKKDLQKYYCQYIGDASTMKRYKSDLFQDICVYVSVIRRYQPHIDKISKIQGLYRGKKQRSMNKARDCNNSEDFFTFEPIREISSIYYYSYEDEAGFKWGFDIRSLSKLISMNYSNPYTTEDIPVHIRKDVEKTMEYLRENPKYSDIMDTVVRDRETTIKQKTVDLFSKIEQSGYTCHVEWFLKLSVRRLISLYKQLEDIWNYRAQLNHQMKRIICPPDGQMFRIPISEVSLYTDKQDLQELILGEIGKFTGGSEANMKLGFMYFVIGFGYVSKDCYYAHQDWLNLVGY